MEKKYKLTSYGESSIDKESQEELLKIVNSGSFPKITGYYLKKKGIEEIKDNGLGIEFDIWVRPMLGLLKVTCNADNGQEAEALKDLLNSLVKLDEESLDYLININILPDVRESLNDILSNLRKFKEIKNG